ncbi:hypothetical protein D1O30_12985 [Methylocystis hirsuta]|uniref:Uncharacterized protein n=2 Tax=Methylocystis hirsuta TaxID=369798 RepID=A0A3M9XQT3_9HYPH|nr:hypothetical protein D1O30_12985 [Methylocystis hirsuta]
MTRWFLGAGDTLPQIGDRFLVRINIGEATGPILTERDVGARLRAMLDPPRVQVDQPYLPVGVAKWQVATLPQTDVDCAVRVDEQRPAAFGVCHLLSESNLSRAEWRVAHALHGKLLEVVRARRPMLADLISAAGDVEKLCDRSARLVAALMVRGSTKVRQFRGDLRLLVSGTEQQLSGDALWRQVIKEQLCGVSPAEIVRLQFAALLTGAFRDEEFAQLLSRIIESRTGVRDQLKLRAITGGHLIDFWCSPDGPVGACADGSRGAAYPGSELVGLGTTFGPFDRAAVDGWLAAGGLLVQVHQTAFTRISRDATLNAGPADAPGDLDYFGLSRRFSAGSRALAPDEIRLALTEGSSSPPVKPASAVVNYDIVQSNAGDREPAYMAPTSEAVLDLLIEPGKSAASSVAGFNVYCIWESNATEPLFRSPFENPPIEALRPWLVNRRYSDLLDLDPAFPMPAYDDRLRELRSSPPWNPLLVRLPEGPTVAGSVPDPFYPGLTLFRYDLRQGMADSAMHWPASPRWDPKAPISSTWAPSKDRAGNDAPGPQRYRLWVTAVDAFEQESDPVPVVTSDAATGDPDRLVFFSPVRRDLMHPPRLDQFPSGVKGGPDRRGVVYDPDPARRVLTFTWKTPLLNSLSRRTDLSQTFEDSAQLESGIVMMRRLLRAKVSTNPTPLKATNIDPPIGRYPQWADRINSLLRQGWEYRGFDSVATPGGDGVWSKTANLTDHDEGYEYKALVGFFVRDSVAAFWAKDAGLDTLPKRKRLRYDADARAVVTELIVETPRASEVAETDSIPVANTRRPRAISVPTTPVLPKFVAAGHVYAPPGLRRDRILMRLLDAPPSSPIESPWSDSGAKLTSAQAAMMQFALLRCRIFGDDEAVVATDPKLEAARWILASEFRSQPVTSKASVLANSSVTNSHQHPTIGFRGLFPVVWTYEPRLHRQRNPDDAEAVIFRIYAARAPRGNLTAAAACADLKGTGSITAVSDRLITVEFTPSSPDPDDFTFLRFVACANRPAFARIEAGSASYGAIRGISNYDCNRGAPGNPMFFDIELTANSPVPPVGAPATTLLFGARAVWETPAQLNGALETHIQYLPAGGGPAEYVAYWIGTVSAQGNECAHVDRLFVSAPLKLSVEPAPISDLKVGLPTRPEEFLDTRLADEKRWLPSQLQSATNTQDYPRLVVSWDGLTADPDTLIKVNRRIQSLDMRFAGKDDQDEWQALVSVASLPDGQPIELQILDLLKRRWLRGSLIPFPTDPSGDYDKFIKPEKGMKATAGMKSISGRPTIVDYCADNNWARAMNGASRYSYQLIACLPLDPESNTPDNFLESPPTTWTDPVQPQAPPFKVTPGQPTIHADASLIRPRVVLQVIVGVHPLAEARILTGDVPWVYQVQVLRLLPRSILTTPLATPSPAWLEIASCQLIEPGSTSAFDFVDDDLERDGPGRPFDSKYRVVVQQIASADIAGGRARIVRSQASDDPLIKNELTVHVPAPDPDGESETAVSVPILLETTLF